MVLTLETKKRLQLNRPHPKLGLEEVTLKPLSILST